MVGCADSMIAMLVPKAPPKHISSRDGEIEDEDEDLVSALTEGFFDTCLYEVAVSELTIDRNCWRLIHCEGAIISYLQLCRDLNSKILLLHCRDALRDLCEKN